MADLCCQKERIQEFVQNHPDSSYAQRALEILGIRVDSLFYYSDNYSFAGIPYIVEAIFGSTDTTGIEIATTLRVLASIYDKDVKIFCRDLINPYQVTDVYLKEDGKWDILKDNPNRGNTFFFEDETFLTIVQKGPNEIFVALWKKN